MCSKKMPAFMAMSQSACFFTQAQPSLRWVQTLGGFKPWHCGCGELAAPNRIPRKPVYIGYDLWYISHCIPRKSKIGYFEFIYVDLWYISHCIPTNIPFNHHCWWLNHFKSPMISHGLSYSHFGTSMVASLRRRLARCKALVPRAQFEILI